MGSLTLAAGCGTDDTCDPPRVIKSSQDGTPSLVFSSTSGVVVDSSGNAVCVTCTTLRGFDTSFHQARQMELPSAAATVAGPLAFAADGALYVVMSPAQLSDHTVPTSPVSLAAYAPDGSPAWTAPLPDAGFTTLIAAADGPYTQGYVTSGDPFTITYSAIEKIDPATGAAQQLADGSQVLLGAAPGGGVITADQSIAPTVRRYDASGAVKWSLALSTNGAFQVGGALALADGKILVYGRGAGAVNAGALTVDQIVPGPFGLEAVIAVDDTGQPVTGYDAELPIDMATPDAQGNWLLASSTPGPGFNQIEVTFGVATTTGVTSTTKIPGDEIIHVFGLAAGPNHTAWLQIDNTPDPDDDRPGGEPLQVNGESFAAQGEYLINLPY